MLVNIVAGVVSVFLAAFVQLSSHASLVPACENIVSCRILIVATPGFTALGPQTEGKCQCVLPSEGGPGEEVCSSESCSFSLVIGGVVPAGHSVFGGGQCHGAGQLVLSTPAASVGDMCGAPSAFSLLMIHSGANCVPANFIVFATLDVSCSAQQCDGGDCS